MDYKTPMDDIDGDQLDLYSEEAPNLFRVAAKHIRTQPEKWKFPASAWADALEGLADRIEARLLDGYPLAADSQEH